MVSLHSIRESLQTSQGLTPTPGPQTRSAAVAIILCGSGTSADDLHLGYIQRAERDGDPWSAQMAFPGGHLDPDDHSLMHAAVRETAEEIAVDLSAADYLGALEVQHAVARGKRLDMIIQPHVFSLPSIPATEPNYEVADVVWANLGKLMSNAQHDTETMPMNGAPTVFNGYRIAADRFVWGLTYRMTKSFFTRIDPSWQPPLELE